MLGSRKIRQTSKGWSYEVHKKRLFFSKAFAKVTRYNEARLALLISDYKLPSHRQNLDTGQGSESYRAESLGGRRVGCGGKEEQEVTNESFTCHQTSV